MIGVEYHNNTNIKQTFQNFANIDENLILKDPVARVGVLLKTNGILPAHYPQPWGCAMTITTGLATG